MNFQSPIDPAELHSLTTRFGSTPHETHRLSVRHPFLTGNHQELTKNGRRAEICYIMHQGNLEEGVLLHIKTFYPPGAFRLPTGGIHQGESVVDTLAREIFEETGLQVGENADQVQVERYLGVVEYAIDQLDLGETHHFATYHFIVRMPADGELNPQDEEEHLAGWSWIEPTRLLDVAEFLDCVGEMDASWGDWGRYRALSHRFVWEQIGREG